MAALADEARLGHLAEYGIIHARLAWYSVPQIELLIRIVVRLVSILKVALGVQQGALQQRQQQGQAQA